MARAHTTAQRRSVHRRTHRVGLHGRRRQDVGPALVPAGHRDAPACRGAGGGSGVHQSNAEERAGRADRRRSRAARLGPPGRRRRPPGGVARLLVHAVADPAADRAGDGRRLFRRFTRRGVARPDGDGLRRCGRRRAPSDTRTSGSSERSPDRAGDPNRRRAARAGSLGVVGGAVGGFARGSRGRRTAR